MHVVKLELATRESSNSFRVGAGGTLSMVTSKIKLSCFGFYLLMNVEYNDLARKVIVLRIIFFVLVS